MTSSGDSLRRRPSVVCGVDHSDHAPAVAETATLLAKRLGLRLVFVHAVPASVPPLAPVWPHHAPDDRAEIRRRAIDRGWERVEQFVTTSGLTDVVGRVERGLPAECLRELADEEGAEYIVVGTRGEGNARAALMGSVSLAAVQTALCTVVIVPPSSRGLGAALPRARSILCGVGAGGDRAPVRVACRLADAFDLPLLLAHVVEGAHDGVARDTCGPRTDELLGDVLTDVLETSRPGAAIGRLSGLRDPAIRAGDPAEQLNQLAREDRAGMVVVGTHRRGPVRSGLLGSVSRTLACRGDTPVVVCPPGA